MALSLAQVIAIDIDGSRDADYGAALAVQAAQTGFGTNPGSELDAAYGKIEDGKLHLLLTGNLQANFNKLEVFIDSVPGGQQTIDAGSNPNNDNWANKFDGFAFDTTFEADYLVIVRHGDGGTKFDVDFAQLGAGGSGALIASVNPTNPVSTGPFPTSNGIRFGFDNSNTAGVGGVQGTAADPVAAAAVGTGTELEIPLALIGSPAGEVKVCAMINGSNHDFLSNQFLGALPPTATNLGTDGFGNFVGGSNLGGIDLSTIAGDQFFVVPVEPVDPVIIEVEADLPGGRVSLVWRSRPDAIYQVDVSTDLRVWTDVNEDVVSQGEMTRYDDTDADTSQPRLFYRVFER